MKIGAVELGVTRDAGPLAARPSATGRDRAVGLDGLRAVAVLLVLAFHFGVGGLEGGFFGVDVFFVLSGFLITGLLVGEFRGRGRIGLAGFWLRRARRLLPALVVVLVVVSLVVRFAEPAGQYPGFRMSVLSSLGYFSNWWQIATSGSYFQSTSPPSPLTHIWSLAVEEQFYLVWPFVVLAVMSLSRSVVRGVRALLVVSVAGALASALEMALLYSPSANTTRLYFGTDTHAQCILVGAALACALTIVQLRRGREGMDPVARGVRARVGVAIGGLAGLAVLIVLSCTLTGTSAAVYRGGFALVALSTAAVITAVVCLPRAGVARVLSLSPLVWLGSISYGVYLWHFPVVVFVDAERTGLSGIDLLAVRTACTLGLAIASFTLIERPIMLGTFWRSARALAPATVAVAAAVVAAMSVVPAASAAPVAPSGPAAVRAEWQAVQVASFAGAGGRVRTLLVGDSLALTVGVGLAPYASRYGVDLGGRSHVGCGIALVLPLEDRGVVGDPFPNCPLWPSWWADDIRQLHPQVVGLIIGWWEVQDRIYDGRWQHLGDPAFDAYETAQLERAVAILGSGGAKVALFTAPYFDNGEQPDGAPWPADDPSRVDQLNRIMTAVAARDPGRVAVVPMHEYLDPHGRFTWTIGGNVVRQPDGIHTTLDGGAYLAPKILPQLAALGRTG